MNRGFADLPLNHLGTSPLSLMPVWTGDWLALEDSRTSVHGSKVRCPTTRRRASGLVGRLSRLSGRETGAGDGVRTRDLRPWQGDALPAEPLPLGCQADRPDVVVPRARIELGDTAIFSRVLYQLSYLGASRPIPVAAATMDIEPHPKTFHPTGTTCPPSEPGPRAVTLWVSRSTRAARGEELPV